MKHLWIIPFLLAVPAHGQTPEAPVILLSPPTVQQSDPSWEQAKKDAIMRFVKAYREAADWMYADPKAVTLYAAKIKMDDEALLREAIRDFQPKETMQTDKMADLDGAVADAVKLKFLDAPLTREQVAEFLQIPPR